MKKLYSQGFTITELIVVTAVSGLMTIVLVTFIGSWLGQYAISSVRNSVTTDLQTALTKVNDDVRNSSGLIPVNQVADPNGPNGGYWTSSSTQLVLAQVPRNAAGIALNISGGVANGAYDSTVYYLSNGTLYRRIVAAGIATELATTTSCTPQAGGGCPTDIKIVTGVQSLNFIWLDKTGAVTTIPAIAAAITTDARLSRTQSGQNVSVQNKLTMTPRLPGQFYTNAPLAVGPGGLMIQNGATVSGADIYVGGDLTVLGGFTLGTPTQPISSITVAKAGYCAPLIATAGLGTSCITAIDPIHNANSLTFDGALGDIYATKICANNQTKTTSWTGRQIYGLVPSCIAPKLQLPFFNKGAHTAKMTNSVGPQGCVAFTSGTITIPANTTINGNLGPQGGNGSYCTYTIGGDVYVTGDLNDTVNPTIKVADGLTTRPIIMVNGKINIRFPTIKANNLGITPIFISFYSTDSACSTSPFCSDQDATRIYNILQSQDQSAYAVNLNTPLSLRGSFYAYYGSLQIIQASDVVGTFGGQGVAIWGGGSGVTLIDQPWPS